MSSAMYGSKKRKFAPRKSQKPDKTRKCTFPLRVDPSPTAVLSAPRSNTPEEIGTPRLPSLTRPSIYTPSAKYSSRSSRPSFARSSIRKVPYKGVGTRRPPSESQDIFMCGLYRPELSLMIDLIIHAFGSSKSDWTQDVLFFHLDPGREVRMYTGSMMHGFDVCVLSSDLFFDRIVRIEGKSSDRACKSTFCFSLSMFREEFSTMQSIEMVSYCTLVFHDDKVVIQMMNGDDLEVYTAEIDAIEDSNYIDTIDLMKDFKSDSYSHSASLDADSTRRMLRFTQAMRKSKDVRYCFDVSDWKSEHCYMEIQCARVGSRRTGRYPMQTSGATPLPEALQRFSIQSRQCARSLSFLTDLELSIRMRSEESNHAIFYFQIPSSLVSVIYLIALSDV